MSTTLHPADRTPAAGAPASDACWPCATSADGDAAQAAAFLDRLCALPLTDWLAAAELALREDDPGASEALARLVAERRLGTPAWYVRDAVSTAIDLACWAPDRAAADGEADRRRFLPARPDTARRRLAVAREAAERAALALLVRAWLPPAAFDALYAPFAPVVPAAG